MPREIRPEQFALAVRGPSVADFSGIDVTVSRKRAAYEACHVLTPAARRNCNQLVVMLRVEGDDDLTPWLI